MKKRVLLFIETSRAYGREVICGISQYILQNNNWTVFFEDRGLLEKLPNWMNTWHGDGIIARSLDASVHHSLLAKGVPVVELLGDGHEIVPDITCDDAAIGEMAARHFRERGFRNYAFFSSEDCYWAEKRKESYQKMVASYGYQCHVFTSFKKVRKGYSSPKLLTMPFEIITKWLAPLPKPVALFAASDMHAVYILKACENLNLRIPEDIAILGTDNDILLCSVTTPKLSSISPNGFQIGYQAAQMLDRKMSNAAVNLEPVLLPPGQIFERQSSDHYAVEDSDVLIALNYIRQNATSPISVADVANKVCLSRRTLERRFISLLHRTPNDEIGRIRMQQGEALLLESNLSVATEVDPDFRASGLDGKECLGW